MNKHTPGPWVLDGVQIIPAGGHPSCDAICEMSVCFTMEDANLIAAAPVLLKALKSAYAHICQQTPRVEDGFINGKPVKICRDDLSAVVRLMGEMSAAIEKAEGEA